MVDRRHVFVVILAMVLAGLAFEICGQIFAAAQDQTPSAKTAEQKPATANPDLAEADSLSLEVLKLYQAGKFDEAITPAKRAIKLREKALGANHLRVADALTNLAEIYLVKYKDEDAEPLFKRALAIYEKNPESNGLVVGKILDHLASLRQAKGEFDKAEEFIQRAISVKEKAVGGVNHAEVVYSMTSLADLYVARKDYAKAEPVLQQVIVIKEKAYGKSHEEVGRSLERLACVMYKNNEKTDSERIEARANHILYSEKAMKSEPLVLTPSAFGCRVISSPRPEFPTAAKGRFSGFAILTTEVEVDESGNVIAAHMISGGPIFKKSTEQAALKAKFRPTIVDGRAVRVKGVLVHTFDVVTSVIMVPGTVGRP